MKNQTKSSSITVTKLFLQCCTVASVVNRLPFKTRWLEARKVKRGVVMLDFATQEEGNLTDVLCQVTREFAPNGRILQYTIDADNDRSVHAVYFDGNLIRRDERKMSLIRYSVADPCQLVTDLPVMGAEVIGEVGRGTLH